MNRLPTSGTLSDVPTCKNQAKKDKKEERKI